MSAHMLFRKENTLHMNLNTDLSPWAITSVPNCNSAEQIHGDKTKAKRPMDPKI